MKTNTTTTTTTTTTTHQISRRHTQLLQMQQQQPQPLEQSLQHHQGSAGGEEGLPLHEEVAAATPSHYYTKTRSWQDPPAATPSSSSSLESSPIDSETSSSSSSGSSVDSRQQSCGWRGRSRPKREGKGKQPPQQAQHKKKMSGIIQSDLARTTVLLLLGDDKTKPTEVDLICKTYPKEHEAFTNAFLRQNEFARKIFTRNEKLLKWYFQEDHLTFPRLCLIYQNRCSNGRTNPWVPRLIRGGPSLRGPVVLVQQKKSPNAETVVFDQYRRDDRHMFPGAASLLAISCGEQPPSRQMNTLLSSSSSSAHRALWSLRNSASSLQTNGWPSTADEDAAQVFGYASPFGQIAQPYTMARLSSVPGSPPSSTSASTSASSSGDSSPLSTPPSSQPDSPRSSSVLSARPPVSTSSSFPNLPIFQTHNSENLSCSLSSLPPFLSSEQPLCEPEFKLALTSASEDFTPFSSNSFPYSLWSAHPASETSPRSAPAHSYSDSISLLTHQSAAQDARHQTPKNLGEPLFLSSNNLPLLHLRRPPSMPINPSAHQFSWEDAPELAVVSTKGRRHSVDSSPREGVDEEILAQLKKIRDTPGPSKIRVNNLISAFEEYLRTRPDAKVVNSEQGIKASRDAAVTRQTKLCCHTLIFMAKMEHLSEKCQEDPRDKRAMLKWESTVWKEMRDMLNEGLVDMQLADKILLSCFIQRKVKVARDLMREIMKQASTSVSHEEWKLLADKYQCFSPWLAAFLRKAPDSWTADVDAREMRATLVIIQRSRGRGIAQETEEEVFRTVAPLSATVSELKHRLWQEQIRVLEETGDESPLLRPNELGVIYRWPGGEVELHDLDALHDYLLPHELETEVLEEAEAISKDKKRREADNMRARDGKAMPSPPYEIVITEQPRLLAFAHFPNLSRSLAELKGMVNSEDKEQWSRSGKRQAYGILYDYLCHHFEHLEEQNRRIIHQERKKKRRRKEQLLIRDEHQKKDSENGYHGQGSKEKQMEANENEIFHKDRSHQGRNPEFSSEERYIVHFSNPSPSQGGRRNNQIGFKHCAIHLGSLTTEDEEPLYAVFARNPTWPFHSNQPWIFHAWSDELSLLERHGLSKASLLLPTPALHSTTSLLPMSPLYFSAVEDVYFIPGVQVFLNAEHILKAKANCKKFDQNAYTKDQLASLTKTVRLASLNFALTRCLRALQQDPSLAIPQSCANASGAYCREFLAPLYFGDRKSQPSLAVSLEKRYNSEGLLCCYVATALLTLAQAYANARRVKKIRQTWLTSWHTPSAESNTDQIDANHEEEDWRFEKEMEKWVSEADEEEEEESKSQTNVLVT